MTLKQICETDKKAFEKLRNFQMNNSFKKVGWAIVIVSVLLVLSGKFFEEPNWFRTLFRNLILIGFLVVSFSREKIEDEMVRHLRGVSYRLAFLLGVLYAIIHPYLDYLVDLLLNIENPKIEASYFQIFLYMFMIQIAFFEVMKKRGA
ncbi:hypothetical protein ACFQO1_03010 [Jejudonia soesokkakensis]|uniref:Uncharacterized protein n=1 Tax=Jejudonia soesokkakensis TaxID=1323432 RepID=A0ABW2MPJ0_9FLAO